MGGVWHVAVLFPAANVEYYPSLPALDKANYYLQLAGRNVLP
jgi:hypothetical protein